MQVNDEVANVLVAQLLYLANDDPDKDITLYINSPGGSVSAGMAIYDAMQVRGTFFLWPSVCGVAACCRGWLLGTGRVVCDPVLLVPACHDLCDHRAFGLLFLCCRF